MPLLHLTLLALIQGITEFLPVSSSGHLILFPQLTGVQDQGLVIDVAVHVGTLFAVIGYFWRDVRELLWGLPYLVRGNLAHPGARLAFLLCLATVPVVLVGLTLSLTGLDDALRSIEVIGWTMLGFGILLYWSDQFGPRVSRSANWTRRDAIILGLWQALALLPGTSRSGITITGARFLGFDRHQSARLAMLMSIPTILASGVLLGAEVIVTADLAAARDGAIAAVIAFFAALGALTIMMRLLHSVSFTPYVIYRVLLGSVLLFIAYT